MKYLVELVESGESVVVEADDEMHAASLWANEQTLRWWRDRGVTAQVLVAPEQAPSPSEIGGVVIVVGLSFDLILQDPTR